MEKNVGTLDKYIRIAVGLALLSFIFIWESSVKWFGLIGVVPILTAYFNYCPLYTAIKFSTVEKLKGKR